MVPFEFEYHRPDTVEQAAEIYRHLDDLSKSPVYYGGGTELISMARLGSLSFGAVIDIKSIPECRILDFDNDCLNIGSGVTLSEIKESDYYPLLGLTAGRIADHTIQGKITLGGNLASTIIYRETALPLLLTDAVITTAGLSGLRTGIITDLFRERLIFPKGEFIVKASIDKQALQLPHYHVKRTKNEKINYPLLTLDAVLYGNRLRMAFSGLTSYPFRDRGIENILNDPTLNLNQRADKAAEALSGRLLADIHGSAEYRKYVLRETILNVLETVKS